jgi:tRNA pseudouridine55 synthase
VKQDRETKRSLQPISGFLLVDKPTGMTSRKVVDVIRHHARYRGKIGHSGTLDPMATGLLVLCLGKATRLATYLIQDDKSYIATLELGVETDTGDADGETVFRDEGAHGAIGTESIHRAFERHRGIIRQAPPRFSARKIGGKRAYDLARRGQEVELPVSEVEVKELNILSIEMPRVHFFVKCSSGTYIRSLALDVGRALKSGAHLTSLRRLMVGPFNIGEAESLEKLVKECRRGNLESWLFPPNTVLGSLSRIVVDGHGEKLLRQGASVVDKNFTVCGRGDAPPGPGEEVQVWNDAADFLAVGRMRLEVNGNIVLHPAKVLG